MLHYTWIRDSSHRSLRFGITRLALTKSQRLDRFTFNNLKSLIASLKTRTGTFKFGAVPGLEIGSTRVTPFTTMSKRSLPEITDELLGQLHRCEERIDYEFQDKTRLQAALTHASGADHRLASNERLEFLGDAILGFVVCDALYNQYEDYLEGDLTKIKSVVVSRQTCAKVSKSMGLQEFLIVGKGMASNPTVPNSLLADVFESLIAAIYEDGGFDESRSFIERHMLPEIELAVAGETGGNYKSTLQQLAQREFGSTPVYQLIDEKGPDHSKCFKISAQVGGNRYEPAWGRNKKEAEQRAANNALSEIKGEEVPFPAE